MRKRIAIRRQTENSVADLAAVLLEQEKEVAKWTQKDEAYKNRINEWLAPLVSDEAALKKELKNINAEVDQLLDQIKDAKTTSDNKWSPRLAQKIKTLTRFIKEKRTLHYQLKHLSETINPETYQSQQSKLRTKRLNDMLKEEIERAATLMDEYVEECDRVRVVYGQESSGVEVQIRGALQEEWRQVRFEQEQKLKNLISEMAQLKTDKQHIKQNTESMQDGKDDAPDMQNSETQNDLTTEKPNQVQSEKTGVNSTIARKQREANKLRRRLARMTELDRDQFVKANLENRVMQRLGLEKPKMPAVARGSCAQKVLEIYAELYPEDHSIMLSSAAESNAPKKPSSEARSNTTKKPSSKAKSAAKPKISEKISKISDQVSKIPKLFDSSLVRLDQIVEDMLPAIRQSLPVITPKPTDEIRIDNVSVEWADPKDAQHAASWPQEVRHEIMNNSRNSAPAGNAWEASRFNQEYGYDKDGKLVYVKKTKTEEVNNLLESAGLKARPIMTSQEWLDLYRSSSKKTLTEKTPNKIVDQVDPSLQQEASQLKELHS